MAEVVDQTEEQRAGQRRAPSVYHIAICPFSQRLEILLTLKGCRHLVDFHVVDITRPYPGWLLEKTSGTAALPVLETGEGGIMLAFTRVRATVGVRELGQQAMILLRKVFAGQGA